MEERAELHRLHNTAVHFHMSGDRKAARYVSDTCVYEEALEHGRLIGLYWSAVGQIQPENVTAGLPGLDSLARPIHVFELEIDGQDLRNRWEWVNATIRPSDEFADRFASTQYGDQPSSQPDILEAVIELRHQIRPVMVHVITILDGSPILVRRLEITNIGTAPAALSHVSPWAGLLWQTESTANPSVVSGSKFSLGYLRAETWGQEGNFVWQALPPEHFRIERTQHRSHGSPYFILRNNITGELVFIALGWSGNWFAEFAHRFENSCFFRMGPIGPAPLRIIEPGETVQTPEVHLGFLHCDMDTAVIAWHRHVRTSVLPPRPAGKEMYTVAGRVVEQPGDWIAREIDIAAEMGVEAFMVDAGWYGERFAGWWDHRGDWFEGDWLPGGIVGLRDRAHSKGMLFGLWMEPEAVSEDTVLYRQHPEWVLKTDDGRIPGMLALNLAVPDCAKCVEESIIRVIRDFGLDFYKLDYNITIHEGGQNLNSGYVEHESWRHYETLYRILRRIHREFPNLVLENCASGGGRNDLGMMKFFHYACESDWSVFPFSIRAINAMTLFLLPESICYYHNHIPRAHHSADLDTHLRVTLFALPIFVGFGAQNVDRSTVYFRKTRKYIELAKGFCRSIMAGYPVVYHHTPDIGLLEPAEWCVLEYAAQDRTKAYAGVFKLSNGTANYILRPRGLDLARTYNVTLDNTGQTFQIPGAALALSGLSVKLDATLTSELVLFSACS